MEIPVYIFTGENGFICSSFIWKLNQESLHDIVCVDSVNITQRPQLLAHAKYKKFLGENDLFDFIKTEYSKISAVFHLGACSETIDTNELFLEKNNTQYTNRLFELATKYSFPFVYASSGAVYGSGQSGFNDATPAENLKPLNLYGWSKLKSDIWIQNQHKNPPRWYGLRFFNVYGPNEYHKNNMRSLVHKAFEQNHDTGTLKLFKSYNPKYEDGKQMRDFVYVKDVVDWMWDLYKRDTFKSGIYNMGYGRARTWLDLATAVFTSLNKPVNITWIDMPDNIRNQYQYFTEAKMKRLLSQGLPSPKWSLESGISDYVQNYLMQNEGYLQWLKS